ncbi:Aflatoxin biosynthesis ketoreductase nor-1 [Lasiodiplodia theobromae]|uniref:Aflatoxin biosynthesis ketoreductase nor-1 n=1 Tax=Lasiodiplodia theobromae TaxID=45133 RepID=UPI0015C3ED74|nr:Aflatoxin biosynthesis ketoreductase nor-1 [Lasiodiplodia theobromae]KAF4546323.1 Aflatoxin biosynthesis ketoreductase nor-1 [Lasiodiplodia theobromae]
MSPNTTTCLITGANRGIGRGLVAAYLARPHHTVIAAVRDPAHPTAQSLHDLVPHAPSLSATSGQPSSSSRLILLQMDCASSASIAAAFAALTNVHGIRALDIVVANAGVGFATGRPLAAEGRAELQRFVDVNAHGPLEVFGGALGLMREAGKAGERKPRFMLVSSNLGSFELMGKAWGYGLYGASKAMANFLIKWLALENAGEVVVFAVHPGPVKTDMGDRAIQELEKMGVDLNLRWLEVEESVKGLQTLIDGAESKNLNGRFFQHDGIELPW